MYVANTAKNGESIDIGIAIVLGIGIVVGRQYWYLY